MKRRPFGSIIQRPPRPGYYVTFLWSVLDDRHRPTEVCKHVVGGGVPAPFRGVAICHCEGEDGYVLFYCDENWEAVTDTWHQTIDEAKLQAEFEYEGVAETWQSSVDGPSQDDAD